MTQEQIDLINKVVWFIPFKNKRDAVRNFLTMIVESINNLKSRNEKIINENHAIKESLNYLINENHAIKETLNYLINENHAIKESLNYLINENYVIKSLYQNLIKEDENILLNIFSVKYINNLEYSLRDNFINKSSKKILFITHDYTLTGAPLAVFNTAKFLKNRGFEVKVIGFMGGEIFDYYSKNGIEAFIINDFKNIEASLLRYISYFDFVFANTIISCNFIDRINGKIPYLWRIAEGKDIETLYINMFPNLYEILSKANNLYAVSKYTQKVLLQYNSNTKILLYGIEDISMKYGKYKRYDDKVRFCNIATHIPRKGQDIIFQAIELLDKHILDKTEFLFMGCIDLQNNPYPDNIKILGVKENLEKYDILSKSDILLHPALDDPNPQVVMEGMMMHKPCIITENVGQKDYIENGISGFIIESGNAQALANLIKYIVENINILEDMSEKSYEVYKKYFDINVYIDNVVSIIEDNLKSDK